MLRIGSFSRGGAIDEESLQIDLGYAPPVKPVILVVDDEPSLQTLIQATLASDYRIISAFNAQEGISKAESIRPDLIIMDVMMPGPNGFEAIKLLSSNSATRAIPVVVLTARDFEPSTIKMIKQESNVVAYLPKPFKPNDLREALKKVIDSKK